MDLVGRDEEVVALRGALAAARHGSRQLVLISGGPGIGKTSLVDHFRLAALEEGARVLTGVAWEDGAPAYWPWTQVVRAAARVAGEDVAPRVAALGPLSGASAQADRFVLYDAVAELLMDLARSVPLVVVLEDLHAAGGSTSDLLEYVHRSTSGTPLVLVATYRPTEVAADEAVAAVVSRLESMGVVLVPRAFGTDEVASMLQSKGLAAEPRLVRAVLERTQGNPLFVAHAAREFVNGGSAADTGLPLGLRNALRRQAQAAEGENRGVLEVAALLAEDIDIAAVAAISGIEEHQVAVAFGRAVALGLLRVDPLIPGRHEFTHALVREALYDGIPPVQTAELHLRAARSLEATGAGPDRLARHFAQAWPVGGALEAVRYAVRAGDEATRAGAHAEAASAYQQAVTAQAHLPAPNADERAELLLALADARLRSGRTEDAHRAAGEALAIASALEDPILGARAALIATSSLPFNDAHVAAVATLREVDERFGETVPPERVAVLARLAEVVSVTDREAAVALALRAERMAPDSGPALAARLDVEWGLHDPREALARASRLATVASDSAEAARAVNWEIVFALESGDVVTATEAVARLTEIADRSRQPALVHLATSRRATLATLLGEASTGLATALEARDVATRFGLADGDAVAWGQLFAVWRIEGLPDDLRADMEGIARDLAITSPYPLAHEAAVVLMLLQQGRRDEARQLFRRAVSRMHTLEPDLLYVWSLALLAEGAIALEDAETAASVYEALLPYADRFVVAAGGVACLGSVSDRLGALAALQGNADAARIHLTDAVRAHRDGGCTTLELASQRALDAVHRARLALELSDGIVTLTHGTETVQLPESLGLRHLAVLVANAGASIAATRLATLAAGEGVSHGEVEQRGWERVPDEVLDRKALASYRSRLAEIDAELAEVREWSDTGRSERLEDERDALLAQLRGALGLGGRQRRFTDEAERARVNVTRAIRSAIKKVGQRSQVLGDHLDRSVTTGAQCCYEPAGGLTE